MFHLFFISAFVDTALISKPFEHSSIWYILSSSSSSRANRADSPPLSLFLYIRPYHPSLPVSLSNYTLYPHSTDVNKFLLIGQR